MSGLRTWMSTAVTLALWGLVLVCGLLGAEGIREAFHARKRYMDELSAVPCEFKLDATRENHIQVPFHHTFDGLHGCVLCIRRKDGMERSPDFKDASFMEFSLLDGDRAVVRGDNATPCDNILLEERKEIQGWPLAWLWSQSPHLAHGDYVLDIVIRTPRNEPSYADLTVVACYNPCGMELAAALVGVVMGLVFCLVSVGGACWLFRRRRRRISQT